MGDRALALLGLAGGFEGNRPDQIIAVLGIGVWDRLTNEASED